MVPMNMTSSGLKIASGIGVNSIVSNACKAFSPKDANLVMKVCVELGILGLTGVAVNAVGKYIDETISEVSETIEKVKIEAEKAEVENGEG